MDFSEVKLIVSDMDGTLLDSRHKLDPEFFNIYQKLKNKNICFAVASGRQYANLLNNFNNIADEIFFIPENGSYLVKGGKELLKNTLEKRYVDEIIGLTRKINNARIVYCGCNKAYIENQDEEFMKVFRSYFDAYEIVDDLTKIDADCLKISICTINGLTSHDIISQYEKYSDRLQIKVSGEVWLDAAHKCSNKGVALKFLQNELKITKDNTMAFGDFMNDIEMLMNAKYSFAMANALPAVKDVAKYMTDTNDNKGVFKILTQIIE